VLLYCHDPAVRSPYVVCAFHDFHMAGISFSIGSEVVRVILDRESHPRAIWQIGKLAMDVAEKRRMFVQVHYVGRIEAVALCKNRRSTESDALPDTGD
jgi:hypothetical protein